MLLVFASSSPKPRKLLAGAQTICQSPRAIEKFIDSRIQNDLEIKFE